MDNFDVAVVGAGFAGLVAALAAAQSGARVVMFEGGARPGGNARIAAGMFIATESTDALHAYIPDGDPALQRLFVETYPQVIDFLESHGLPVGPLEHLGNARVVRPMALGAAGARGEFVDRLIARVLGAGVRIESGNPVMNVSPEEGAYRIDPQGVHARRVILATGGFAANPALLAEFMGPGAQYLRRRSLDGAGGSGLRVARSLGAALAGDMAAYYGHTMADCPLDQSLWQPLTPYFARLGVLVDRTGRRFTDESISFLEESNPQAATRSAIDRYWLLFDERIRLGDGVDIGIAHRLDWLEAARAVGAPVVIAQTLDELIKCLAVDGVDPHGLRAELAAYHAAIRQGTSAALQPPRSAQPLVLDRPPYYALRCVAGVTATCGGVAIDSLCRVLPAQGEGKVIPGLYCAGVDAGGIFGRTYGGFLSWCAVSGYRAGLSAAQSA